MIKLLSRDPGSLGIWTYSASSCVINTLALQCALSGRGRVCAVTSELAPTVALLDPRAEPPATCPVSCCVWERQTEGRGRDGGPSAACPDTHGCPGGSGRGLPGSSDRREALGRRQVGAYARNCLRRLFGSFSRPSP